MPFSDDRGILSCALLPDPVVLPVHCGHCAEPVELHFSQWDMHQTNIDDHWTCPSCGIEDTVSAPGRLTAVTEGHSSQRLEHH